MRPLILSDYQPHLDPSKNIIPLPDNIPENKKLELDFLFVGAGPASLTAAIRLHNLGKEEGKTLEIGIVEKADRVGGHNLSGAVINPMIFQWLFPDMKMEDFPFRQKVNGENFYFLSKKYALPIIIPPGMHNKNNYIASLCEVVRWLSKEAEARGIHIFNSFPAGKLIQKNKKIVGVKTVPKGLNKDGSQDSSFQPEMYILSSVVILAEGCRGHLTQSYLQQENIQSKYPQTYALGVKEIWEVKKETKNILHTIGWPLSRKTFGGTWLYPMKENLLSLGIVVGLDSPIKNFSVHDELQKIKLHPLFQKFLFGGKCIEWGAKTIPEGGFYAVPERLHGNGLLIIGDSAGFVNMSSLKGIHYAMGSGFFAAETLMMASKKGDFSEQTLKIYDKKIRSSFIMKELYKYRNLRQSFHKDLFSGIIKAGLIHLTNGKWPRDFKENDLIQDHEVHRLEKVSYKKNIGLNKTDAVYLSGNQSRDAIPSHLEISESLPEEVQEFYEQLCPAKVYERKSNKLIINPSNCIDCKATDILGPRWNPREGGSGANYKLM